MARGSGASETTVLVTGAGRGIGRAVAVRLARSGWRVYAGVRTDVAAKELAEESDLITSVELDVTVPEHLAGLDGVLPDELDALVNNVGVAVAGPIETLTRNDEHRELYAPHFAGERRLVAKIRRNAQPPEVVAVAVERQLTRRRTRPRTLVGADARTILGMKALLPDRGLDAVWSRTIEGQRR